MKIYEPYIGKLYKKLNLTGSNKVLWVEANSIRKLRVLFLNGQEFIDGYSVFHRHIPELYQEKILVV